ncbi:hypothetical protein J2T56_003134 [Natronobacillus azotifigens]|uniref:Uncharacterized protein n=1 Tax=Natronobacillus azotifigens TaxID=472978 RepID=A0A9J6RGK9_9BACI|nr:hypothetical protein [Natronobacillus azotifigens]MCZ0704565.1 hypothetical protein [Natronobacillus azotifigens]
MEMVLPKKYVALEQEEMMYLDGGWSARTFGRNLVGIWGSFWGAEALVSKLAKTLGKVSPRALESLTGTYKKIAAKASVQLGKIGAKLGGIKGAIVGTAIAAGGVWALGKKSFF